MLSSRRTSLRSCWLSLFSNLIVSSCLIFKRRSKSKILFFTSCFLFCISKISSSSCFWSSSILESSFKLWSAKSLSSSSSFSLSDNLSFFRIISFLISSNLISLLSILYLIFDRSNILSTESCLLLSKSSIELIKIFCSSTSWFNLNVSISLNSTVESILDKSSRFNFILSLVICFSSKRFFMLAISFSLWRIVSFRIFVWDFLSKRRLLVDSIFSFRASIWPW